MSTNKFNASLLIGFGFCVGLITAGTLLFVIKQRLPQPGNLAEWVTGGLTAGLIAMAWYQLKQQTLQQRQWATLQACDRYDTDERICKAAFLFRNLAHNKKITNSPLESMSEITRLFNYFDAIAIGVQQGLYVEDIVRLHLGSIIKTHLTRLEESQNQILHEFKEDFDSSYEALIKLRNSWK